MTLSPKLSLRQNGLLWGDVHPACYKTMQPNRRLLKHLTGGGFGVKFSKDLGLYRSGATARILTAGKHRINLAKTFSCDILAIVAEFTI